MQLIHRIKRLEEQAPRPMGQCPGCGDIDAVKGSGLMHGGLLLQNWDAPRRRDLVWCKICCRRFTCIAGQIERGSYRVDDVFFDDRLDPLTPRRSANEAV